MRAILILSCLFIIFVAGFKSSRAQNYVCYHQANCGAAMNHPLYDLGDSVHDCCSKPDVVSVEYHQLDNVNCRDCGTPMAVRITPRIIALYPPQPLVLEIAVTGYTSITWTVNGTIMHDFLRVELDNNKMKFTLRDTDHTDIGEYEADVRMINGTTENIDFIVQTYVSPDINISTPTETDITDDHVTITCTSQGNPIPTVSLYCDDELNTTIPLPDVIVEGSFDDNDLTVVTSTLQVAANDANGLRKCYCTVSAFDGSQNDTTTDSINLLSTSPTLMVDSLYSVVTVPSIIELHCSGHGRPLPTITWSKNGVNLASNLRTNISEVADGYTRTSTLTISQSNRTDHGVYHCTVTNIYGNQTENNITVNVLFPPVVTIHNESLIEINTNLHNDEVTFYCEAESNPLATVLWVTGVTESEEYAVLNQHCTGGKWNDLIGGEASLDYDIITNYLFNFSDSSESIPKNCIINITEHNESAIPFPLTRTSLTIRDLLYERSGTFYCIGSNTIKSSIKTVKLILDGSPYLSQAPTPVPSLFVGNTAVYRCHFISRTPLYITWLLNGSELTEHFDDINITETSNDNGETVSVLTVYNVQLSDEGTYSCKAQNDNGTSIYNITQVISAQKVSLIAVNTTVREGDDIPLICRAQGNPVPDITWTFTSNITGDIQTLSPLDSNETDYEITSRLDLTNVTRSDAGRYTCTANSTLIDESSHVNMKVLVPVNIARPNSGDVFNLIIGDTIDPNITCQATGISAPTVNILHYNGTPTNVSPVTTVLLNDGLYRSEIKLNVNSNSAGNYTCIATNELGLVNRSFSINIHESITFNSIPNVDAVIRGHSVSLICSFFGDEQHSNIISWYHDSNGLVTDGSRVFISNTAEEVDDNEMTLFNSVLTLSQSESSDAGLYSCGVTNRYGTRQQSIVNLKVLVPSNVTVTPSEVYQVQGVTEVTCTGTGTPLPRVNFDGIICPSGGEQGEANEILQGNLFSGYCDGDDNSVRVILSIENNATIMRGPHILECMAQNNVSNASAFATIHMTGPPVIVRPPLNETVITGHSVTVSCIASAYPPPTIQWAYLDINNLLNDTGIVTEQYGTLETRSNLTITDYDESTHEGLYYCIASNEYYTNQTVYSSFRISTSTVSPSVITLPTNDTLAIGSNINITCQASGRPSPSITWSKDGTVIDGEDIITMDESDGLVTSVLILENIQLSNEGDYNCSASSEAFPDSSVDKIVKRLIVSVPPTVMITPPSLTHVLPGPAVSLTCTGTGKPAPNVIIGGRQCIYEDIGSGSDLMDWSDNGVTIRCSHGNNTTEGVYTVSVQYTLTNDVINLNDHNVTCSAENILTSVTTTAIVTTQVLKSVSVPVKHMSEPERGTYTVECRATGSPYPTLDWLYGDDNEAIVYRDRHSKSNDVYNNAYTVSSTLTVRDLLPSDAGEYKCRAQYTSSDHIVDSTELIIIADDDCDPNPCVYGTCTDEVGGYTCVCTNTNYTGLNCSERIPEQVVSPTVTQDPANITEVHLLGSFNLTCQATGTGPMYLWRKDGIITNENTDTLFIKEAQPDDRGYYICIAANAAGNSTSNPGLVVIPGLYQYVATFEKLDPQDDGEITNITSKMGECLGRRKLPDLNSTFIYSVAPCDATSCNIAGVYGSVIVSLFQEDPPHTFDGIRAALWNKLQSLESDCGLGIRITDVWRFDGCRREDTILHKEYNINITWPESNIGDDTVDVCPCGTLTKSQYINETASRQCRGTFTNGGMWLESDTSQCNYNTKDINITLTLCHLTTVTDVKARARALAQVSQREATHFEEFDFTVAVLVLEGLTQSKEIINSQELQYDYTETISNLLSVDRMVIKSSHDRHASISKLLQSMESFVDIINIPDQPATSVTKSSHVERSTMRSVSFRHDKFGLIVSELNTTDYNNQTFTTIIRGSNTLSNISLQQGNLMTGEEEEDERRGTQASIFLPDSLISKCPQNSVVRISYNAFMTSVFFQADSSTTFGRLISDGNLSASEMILSATACKGSLVEGLEEPVIIEFPKPQYLRSSSRNTSESLCVFWDDNIGDGSWSMRGCVNISNENDDFVRCSCNHLTHFGYLFDVKPTQSGSSAAETTLEIITYIGVIISAVCVIITIVTFLFSKKLLERTQGKTILNMCMALLGIYIAYLVAANAQSLRRLSGGDVLCAFFGAVLYYFMLVYFIWTAIEAIDLYRKLVVVFYNKTPYFIIIGGIVAWVVPLIITAISVGAGHDYYLEYEFFCRPIGLPFYIGFLVPFAVIYIFDWIIFIVIMVKLLIRNRKKKKSGMDKHAKHILTSKQLFLMAMILSVNFGLGWIFGLLATGQFPREAYLTFVYLFSIFVAMQGILIFIIHCLRVKDARDLWRFWFTVIFCCRKPNEVKASSRSAAATAMPTNMGYLTPAIKHKKFDNKKETIVSETFSKERIHDSNEDVRNPIYGMDETSETTEMTFLKLPSTGKLSYQDEEIDIGFEMALPLQELPSPPPIVEIGETEETTALKKTKKKTSKKGTKTKTKTSVKESKKKLSKQESKTKMSKKVSKKKLQEDEELRPLELQELGGGSAYSLGEVSLTGSQALEIEFAPTAGDSEEEEEETWRKLQKQFDNIHALVNESFVEEAEANFTLKLESPEHHTATSNESSSDDKEEEVVVGKQEVEMEEEEVVVGKQEVVVAKQKVEMEEQEVEMDEQEVEMEEQEVEMEEQVATMLIQDKEEEETDEEEEEVKEEVKDVEMEEERKEAEEEEETDEEGETKELIVRTDKSEVDTHQAITAAVERSAVIEYSTDVIENTQVVVTTGIEEIVTEEIEITEIKEEVIVEEIVKEVIVEHITVEEVTEEVTEEEEEEAIDG